MTAVYIDYRPNDKVLISDPGIEGRVIRVVISGNDGIVYDVQFWQDGEPVQYTAYADELELVAAHVEAE